MGDEEKIFSLAKEAPEQEVFGNALEVVKDDEEIDWSEVFKEPVKLKETLRTIGFSEGAIRRIVLELKKNWD